MTDYKLYDSFEVDRPSDGLLRITLNRPERLNALDADGHRQLADIWRDIERDRDTLAVLLTAKGRAFSAGGDFEIVEDLMVRPDARANMARGARPRLQYHQLSQTHRFRHQRVRSRCRSCGGPSRRYSGRCQDRKAC
jgi:enoyl-CoA hydratase/carnithine racemase